jgi:hypothetical protein
MERGCGRKKSESAQENCSDECERNASRYVVDLNRKLHRSAPSVVHRLVLYHALAQPQNSKNMLQRTLSTLIFAAPQSNRFVLCAQWPQLLGDRSPAAGIA